MDGVVIQISQRFYFKLFFLVDNHPRLFLLSATSSLLSPVYSYGGYARVTSRLAKRERVKARSFAQCCNRVSNPSILTLCDFVAAFAGLFLRRLCSSVFYTIIGCRYLSDITSPDSYYGLIYFALRYSTFYALDSLL